MDVQPHIKRALPYDPANIKTLNFAGFMPKFSEYTTKFVNFPGANAMWRWGTEGQSFMTFSFYSAKGKKIGEFHTHCASVDEYFDIEFDDYLSLLSDEPDGIMMIEYSHPRTIPADVYIAYVHRKTGAYVAYPPSPYSGDTIFVSAHATELDNTLFWPGVIQSDAIDTQIALINPFRVVFPLQISLYSPTKGRAQTDIVKLRPFSQVILGVKELFPDHAEALMASKGEYSLCVAAQYKVNAYVIIRNKETQAMTTIDHLHRYCLV